MLLPALPEPTHASAPETSKASPGPWRAHMGQHLRVLSANGGVICGVHRQGRFLGRKPSDVQDEAIANLHLLAAARDMLTALKAYDARYGWRQFNHCDCAECKMFRAGAAAIAKAEGRAP